MNIFDTEDIKNTVIAEKLGAVGFARFIQSLNNGSGDYTAEREELLKDFSIEDFEKFQNDNIE